MDPILEILASHKSNHNTIASLLISDIKTNFWDRFNIRNNFNELWDCNACFTCPILQSFMLDRGIRSQTIRSTCQTTWFCCIKRIIPEGMWEFIFPSALKLAWTWSKIFIKTKRRNIEPYSNCKVPNYRCKFLKVSSILRQKFPFNPSMMILLLSYPTYLYILESISWDFLIVGGSPPFGSRLYVSMYDEEKNSLNVESWGKGKWSTLDIICSSMDLCNADQFSVFPPTDWKWFSCPSLEWNLQFQRSNKLDARQVIISVYKNFWEFFINQVVKDKSYLISETMQIISPK